MNNANTSLATAEAAAARSCGVLHRNGVFYATLRMQGEEAPLEVALHGIRSESEAQQAFATLVGLRQARCASPAKP